MYRKYIHKTLQAQTSNHVWVTITRHVEVNAVFLHSCIEL